MKKKQLYAILLAGVLAVGTVPSAVWAAEDGAAVETGETLAEEGGEATEAPSEPVETPAAELPAEPTEAPVTEIPAEPTAVPEATQPATETPAGSGTDENTAVTQDSAVNNAGSQPGVTEIPQDAAGEDTGISINGPDGQPVYYQTLQEAVDAVTTTGTSEEATVIRITNMLSLTSTVTVSDKKVCIKAAAADLSISRGDDGSGVFDGNMFSVEGSGSELQFAAEDSCSLTISGDNGQGEESPSAGSIINVGAGAAFGLSSGVTLTESNSSADGAAIMNDSGSIVLQGGSIIGNKGTKGAVYTNTDITVQGNVLVKDNTGANLYLDTNSVAVVTGAMTGSDICMTVGEAADGQTVIKAGNMEDGTPVSKDDFAAAAAQFSYDDAGFSIVLGEDETTAVLKAQGTATPTVVPSGTPAPTVIPSQTPTPTAVPSQTATPTPTPTTAPSTSFLTYQSGSLKWVDHNTISVNMATTKDCKWYYFFVDADTSTSVIQGMYDSSRAVNSANANTTFTVKAENVPEEETWLVVAAKPTSGNVQMRVLKLNSDAFLAKRPSATPSGSTRAPRTYSVTESTVTGLEEPLKFFPSTFYEFSVTGAGQNDKAPYVSGDERWIPMYWSTSQNPSNDQKNTTWRIGSTSGITQAATYNMYIFFKKQVYNGSEWTDTDVIESITTQFRSAEITDEELAELTTTPGVDYGTSGGAGGYSAELTATAAASSKDSASSTKSAVSTADESPIGTFSVLAVASLAAGGYILTRKRKKES